MEETYKEMLVRMKLECESCAHYKVCCHDRKFGAPFIMPNPMFYSLAERNKIYELQKENAKKPCSDYLRGHKND